MSMQFTPGEQPWRPAPAPKTAEELAAEAAAGGVPASVAAQAPAQYSAPGAPVAPATSVAPAAAAPATAGPAGTGAAGGVVPQPMTAQRPSLDAYSQPVPPQQRPVAQAAPQSAPQQVPPQGFMGQQPAAPVPTNASLHPAGGAPERPSFLEERRMAEAAAAAAAAAAAVTAAQESAPQPDQGHGPSVRAQGIPASAADQPYSPIDPAAAFAAAAAEQLPSAPTAFEPAPEPAPAPAPVKRAPVAESKPRATGQVGQRVGMSLGRDESDLDINAALRAQLALGASDLHLTTGAPPMVRLDGELTPLEGFERLNPESLQRTLYGILTQAQREHFEEELELDFSYSVVGEARFRVNLYRQRDSLGAAFRVIPYEIKPLESLGIPEVVSGFAQLPRGLVLVTGPTGSGKSTTLASLVDLANRSRSAHIMTVEDPIEFLHRHKRSLVNQREVGADTRSFGKALRHVLRQDPDIILIGEMRDIETISVALTAAETGHLVFATLHTQSAPQTIDRIIDVFPPEQQGQVRTQLASAIQGVLCQTLLKRADGPGRSVAVEIMVATPGIRNLIREGKTHQIYTSMQGGASLGMQTMDHHLSELVKTGRISYEVAVEMCHSFDEFNRLCGRHGQQ